LRGKLAPKQEKTTPEVSLFGRTIALVTVLSKASRHNPIGMQSKFVSNQVRVQSELYSIGKYYLIVNVQSRQSPKMQNCGNRAQPVRI